jgi:N-acetylmuramoyl-L-alanine amidase
MSGDEGTMKVMTFAVLVFVSATLVAPPSAHAQTTPKAMYERALERERTVRDAAQATLRQVRAAIALYEAVVRRHPASGYSDNALWQGGNLALYAFERFGQAADSQTAQRLLKQLIASYPSSSLLAAAREIVGSGRAASPPARTAAPTSATSASAAARLPILGGPVTIREISKTMLPQGVRVSIELDGEVAYHVERLENPRRVFFDITGARAAASLFDAGLKYQDDLVREIRLGRHPHATRVVMDMEGAEHYSVFTLYNPFRIVVDFKRAAAAAPMASATLTMPPTPLPTAPETPPTGASAAQPLMTRETPAPSIDSATPADAKPVPARPITGPPPALPSVNRDGSFSLARQLGLGISRIVIDAGHGGHDPGASANGLAEAELTLDVALRLTKLLQKQPGVEVVMTRSTDVFIPLEERTAIANREGADLFLSIHANASRNVKARGVETYYLNFATNPEAEAVAARENAGSAQTMHRLPEIVKAIALNNKVDESRDFAAIVQRAMVRRLATRNKSLRDLGVKQAPFVVLIGAAMPSVLAEISFVTNKQEGALLKTGAYRQQIAEALLDAVIRYQQSLKKMRGASTTQSAR